jgi:CheY-like chemotaxis protein
MEGSLVICDFEAEPSRHRKQLSQLPAEQVAICLIPASDRGPESEADRGNVIYIQAPFSTTAVHLALEKADEVAAKIKIAPPPLSRPEETSTSDNGAELILNLNRATGHSTNPLQAEPARAPTTNPLDANYDVTSPPAIEPDSVASVSTPVVPVLRNLAISPRPTALLVDDNVVNLRIMQMYCGKRGLPHFCAADGKEAVEIFSRHQSSSAAGGPPAIQLILMDLQMPVCDGVEATRQIRSLEKQNKWDRTALFIVTGQDSGADRAASDSAGADEFFVKPVGI